MHDPVPPVPLLAPPPGRPRRPGRARGLRRLGPAVLVLVAVAGCAPGTGDRAGSAGSTSASSTAPTAPPAAVHAGAPSPGGTGTGGSAGGTVAPPAKITIASVGISSPLMRLGLNADGTVEVPPADQGMTAGWYSGGPAPGAVGPAVIIGHNDTRYGRAVFHDLRKIAKGADITVTDDRGRAEHFTVTGTRSVSKKSFPTQQVYGATSDRALRLITCDGSFDADGHPVNNLIVYATLDR
ncbi:class F sortase [Actinacidiphila polyblastidii]|uniref:class F sortase n=1 Tax=Actinacidiphila polyblastidii TaxID=3110430 RepID=UPI0039BD2437